MAVAAGRMVARRPGGRTHCSAQFAAVRRVLFRCELVPGLCGLLRNRGGWEKYLRRGRSVEPETARVEKGAFGKRARRRHTGVSLSGAKLAAQPGAGQLPF